MVNEQLFINGVWVEGKGQIREIINPADGNILTEIYEATENQTKQAVEAARYAFDKTDWSFNKDMRVKVLLQIANLLESNADEISEIETNNTGKPIRESEMDIQDSVACLRYYAELVKSESPLQIEMNDGSLSHVISEPIGVCSLIVPWNFPLLLGMWKIAPALAAGNTIVFKPSELTPLSLILFTELLTDAGVPEGVFNLVLGDGVTAGSAMTTDSDVDKVSFTGGVETGRKINEICAKTFKRVSLELGGKSPMVVLDDADVDKAVEWILFGGFFNQGEVCVASSRILIHESIYNTVINELCKKMKSINIGSPVEKTTEMGPIISEEHLNKILNYLTIGVNEGACLTGGKRINRDGYYIEPAIFTNVKQHMQIVQEEIFGPVITIQSFKNDEEAIQLANGTKFGLAAGIISKNVARANDIASRIKAGTIWINNYHIPYVEAPWGGYKQSGIGRELGPHGLAAFTEVKHVNRYNTLESLDWYKLD
ncbi:aldehyde dehydrogenase family protein [Virgibacillus sp. DJP39]|uniref:aldehyde dehydrogenase family protein n=1 Tax=Virgibacillus sp. DJP39 TaxID=3409790 RepID=UPI003BB6EF2F